MHTYTVVIVDKVPFSIGRGRGSSYRIGEMKISSKYVHVMFLYGNYGHVMFCICTCTYILACLCVSLVLRLMMPLQYTATNCCNIRLQSLEFGRLDGPHEGPGMGLIIRIDNE